MSATRPRPQLGERPPQGSGKGVARFQRHVPDSERERLSEAAKKRHAEGGFKPSGKPRKPRQPSKRRVAQRVAEAAREKKNAQAIIDVFKDGIHPSQPISIRLKAAEAWIKVEVDATKLALREEGEESQRLGREQLIELISEKLTNGHAAVLLRQQLEEQAGIIQGDVIEGSVIDDEQ